MMPRLVDRLRQRKLVQWAAAYLAGAWLLLQVLDLLGENFGWPAAIERIATVLLGVGLVAALVLAWYHGERGHQGVTAVELLMLAGILVIAGVGVALVGGGVRESPGAATSPPADSAGRDGSIAVLPFADMSPTGDQEYFGDGVAEEILNGLAKLEGLRVASRTSSFRFKGEKADVRDVGRTLGVATVLEGSVRKDGNRLRITAQLISARDGYHLWSETYERELSSVFQIQDEISRAVVQALQLRLGGNDRKQPLVQRGTDNVAAYELYLKGRYFWNRESPEGFRRAIDFYRQALDLDPEYAPAYQRLADAYIDLGAYEDRLANVARGRAALERALEIDPNLGSAYDTRGWLRYTWDWDPAAAERDFRRSLELDPRHGVTHSDYGHLLLNAGRTEEGLSHLRKVLELDPITPSTSRSLALGLLKARRYEEAIATFQATIELDSTQGRPFSELGIAYRLAQRIPEAIAAQRRAVDVGYGPAPAQLAFTLAVAGQPAEARKLLREMETSGADLTPSTFWIALAYGALGEREAAFRWLDRAATERHVSMVTLGVFPDADPLRGDPRLAALVRKIGHP